MIKNQIKLQTFINKTLISREEKMNYRNMSKKERAKAWATGALLAGGITLGSLWRIAEENKVIQSPKVEEQNLNEENDLEEILGTVAFLGGLATFGGTSQSLKYTREHLQQRKRAKERAKKGHVRYNGPKVVMPPEKTLTEKLQKKGKKLKRKYF